VAPFTLPRALERIGGRDAAIGGDAQDLAEQHVLVARRVIGSAATAVVRVVAAAVPDGDVEETVLAEVEVAAVVVAGGRLHVVEQHHLGRRIDDVAVRQEEARDPIDADRVRRPQVGVVEKEAVVRREGRIDGDAEEAALGIGADRRQRQGRRGEQRAVGVDAEGSSLRRDQHSPVRREGEAGGHSDRGHQRVREPRRKRQGRRPGKNRNHQNGEDEAPRSARAAHGSTLLQDWSRRISAY
jgi:hypothetical protein